MIGNKFHSILPVDTDRSVTEGLEVDAGDGIGDKADGLVTAEGIVGEGDNSGEKGTEELSQVGENVADLMLILVHRHQENMSV